MTIPPPEWQGVQTPGPFQPPTPIQPPATMVNAVRLMYAGAGLAAAVGVSYALTTHATVPPGVADPAAYREGYALGSILMGLVMAGLWLWMARANKRGHSWARILCTVFFGLLTLWALVGVLFLPLALKLIDSLLWAAGLTAIVFLWQGTSSAYYQAVNYAAAYRAATRPPG